MREIEYTLRLHEPNQGLTAVVNQGDAVKVKVKVQVKSGDSYVDVTDLSDYDSANLLIHGTSAVASVVSGAPNLVFDVPASNNANDGEWIFAIYLSDSSGNNTLGNGMWKIQRGPFVGPATSSGGPAGNIPISQVTGLQTALDGKEPNLQSDTGTKLVRADALGAVTYVEPGAVGKTINDSGTTTSEVFSAAEIISRLGTKAALSHTHPISEVTDLQNQLDGKAANSHVHAISEVTGLQAAIDGKEGVVANPVTNDQIRVYASNGAVVYQNVPTGGASTIGALSDVDSGVIASKQVLFVDDAGAEVTSSDGFQYDATLNALILKYGAPATSYFQIRATAGEIEFTNGGNWGVLEAQSYKLKNGGQLTYDGNNNLTISVANGITYKSAVRHRFEGGPFHFHLPSTAPQDSDINNDEGVAYRDGNDIKIRVRGSHATPGQGALGTATITVTMD